MLKKASIQFLGATGTVTGSKHLLRAEGKLILIDCGLFQGIKKLRIMNWADLPFNVEELDCVLLTHAHLDHVGFLPRLVKKGFKGKIIGTAPTLQIANIVLKDSARIQEEETKRANKYGYSKHQPAEPLYTEEDVEKTTTLFYPMPIELWINLYDGIKIQFKRNGHIIGATFIELDVSGTKIVFSGDIGREEDLLLYPPEKPIEADILVIESTYGNRLHPENDVENQLQRIILEVIKKKGILIIPSFAVERSQLLMYILWKMEKEKKIPKIPIVLDSPMGAAVFTVFQNNKEWHKLSRDDCDAIVNNVKIVRSHLESTAMIGDSYPKIVIAGSGMVTGGRVLGYLEKYLEDHKATILITGFQAEGTRGRQLLEGTQEVKMFGKYFKVNASIINIKGMSGHADQGELIGWMKNLNKAPKKIFIVHGEPEASDALRVKIKDVFGWDSEIPNLNELAEFKIPELQVNS